MTHPGAGAPFAPVVVVSCIYKLPPPPGDISFRATYFRELWEKAGRMAAVLNEHRVPMIVYCDEGDMRDVDFERFMSPNVMMVDRPLHTFPGAHVFIVVYVSFVYTCI